MSGTAGERGDAEAAGVAVAVEDALEGEMAHRLGEEPAVVALVEIEARLVPLRHVERESPVVLAQRRFGGAAAAHPPGRWRQAFELPHAGVAALVQALDADVNQTLRDRLKQGERYDAIVLDPPKFAPTAAHAERAARAYKDINRLAFKLLEPGGLLFTFSCSGGIGAELFHKIVAGAGLDAGADGLIYARVGAAPDHPMTVTFPEGEYLKGLLIIKR